MRERPPDQRVRRGFGVRHLERALQPRLELVALGVLVQRAVEVLEPLLSGAGRARRRRRTRAAASGARRRRRQDLALGRVDLRRVASRSELLDLRLVELLDAGSGRAGARSESRVTFGQPVGRRDGSLTNDDARVERGLAVATNCRCSARSPGRSAEIREVAVPRRLAGRVQRGQLADAVRRGRSGRARRSTATRSTLRCSSARATSSRSIAGTRSVVRVLQRVRASGRASRAPPPTMTTDRDDRDQAQQLHLAVRRDPGQPMHQALPRVEAALDGASPSGCRHVRRAPGGLNRPVVRRVSCCSRSAPSSVVTERSRAEWPIRPIRQASPANSPEPAPDLDAVLREQRLAQHRLVDARRAGAVEVSCGQPVALLGDQRPAELDQPVLEPACRRRGGGPTPPRVPRRAPRRARRAARRSSRSARCGGTCGRRRRSRRSARGRGTTTAAASRGSAPARRRGPRTSAARARAARRGTSGCPSSTRRSPSRRPRPGSRRAT